MTLIKRLTGVFAAAAITVAAAPARAVDLRNSTAFTDNSSQASPPEPDERYLRFKALIEKGPTEPEDKKSEFTRLSDRDVVIKDSSGSHQRTEAISLLDDGRLRIVDQSELNLKFSDREEITATYREAYYSSAGSQTEDRTSQNIINNHGETQHHESSSQYDADGNVLFYQSTSNIKYRDYKIDSATETRLQDGISHTVTNETKVHANQDKETEYTTSVYDGNSRQVATQREKITYNKEQKEWETESSQSNLTFTVSRKSHDGKDYEREELETLSAKSWKGSTITHEETGAYNSDDEFELRQTYLLNGEKVDKNLVYFEYMPSARTNEDRLIRGSVTTYDSNGLLKSTEELKTDVQTILNPEPGSSPRPF